MKKTRLVLAIALAAIVSLPTVALAQTPPTVPVLPDAPGVTWTGSTRLQEYANYLQIYKILDADLKMVQAHQLDLTALPFLQSRLKTDYAVIKQRMSQHPLTAGNDTLAAEAAQMDQEMQDLEALNTSASQAVGRDQYLGVMTQLLSNMAADQKKSRALLISSASQDQAVTQQARAALTQFLTGDTGTYHVH